MQEITIAIVIAIGGVCPMWTLAAHAADPANPPRTFAETANGSPIVEEFARQKEIFQSKGEDVPEGYVIDRSLLAYTFTLSSEFDRSLANLGPADRWLDIGAGEGQAILDYYAPRFDSMHPEGRARRGKKARAVAISIEDRRTPRWHKTSASLEGDQIRYLSGKRLREYSSEELGRFQLITDLMGGFSYTANLSLFMEKVLGLMDLTSSFYTVLMDVRSELETNQPYYPDSPFRTEIVTPVGSEVKVCSWLKNIACVEVTCELKTEWQPPIEVYRIRKVCGDVSVPALVLTHFEAGTPPERRFQLIFPSTAPSGAVGAAR